MTHANAFVLETWAEIKALGFSPSECVVIREDDILGNFGIAWYFGRFDGCGHMSYDEGYIPSKHTVVHEFGHDMHNRWQTFGIMGGLWTVVGFPVTMEQSLALGSGGSQYDYWRHTPQEMLADLFAWTVLGDMVQTEMHGIPLTQDLRDRLAVFFRSFGKEEDLALTEADKATIQASIDASENRIIAAVLGRLGTMEVDILREVLGKLQSGFNTSVPTFLDRQSAGDKKVATAEIDQ